MPSPTATSASAATSCSSSSPPREPGNDFRYRIWNADGGEVEQCGNGARCFARFVRDEGLTAKDELRVETARGVIRPRIEASGPGDGRHGAAAVRARPRSPSWRPAQRPTYEIEVGGRVVELSVLSMGNPHAVQVVADVDAAPVATQGPLIERHPALPQPRERGLPAGGRRATTSACGCGSAARARRSPAGPAPAPRWSPASAGGCSSAEVRVSTRGGDLTIRWAGTATDMTPPLPPVMMTGDAVRVFEGEIDLPRARPPGDPRLLTPEQVADFLRQNPGFFEQNVDLLVNLQIPHPHGGRAVSIGERQLVAVREKTRLLEDKLRELIGFGEENDAVFGKVHRLACRLLEANGLDAALDTAYLDLLDHFAVPHVAVRLWNVAEARSRDEGVRRRWPPRCASSSRR